MLLPRSTFGLGLGLFEGIENERLEFEVYAEAALKALVAEYLKALSGLCPNNSSSR